jgi:hypothetical protein
VERRDQRGMFGMSRGQLRRGIGEVAPFVMLVMPLGRDDVAQERVEQLIVVDQLPVQGSKVPVIENPPDVEDDSGRTRRLAQP